jgi:hypothetical protein
MEQIKLLDVLQVTMNVGPKEKKSPNSAEHERLAVSLNTLAGMLDAHRSSVRRWLREAGIKPVAIGRGRNGAIRYHWRDVKKWLDSRKGVD